VMVRSVVIFSSSSLVTTGQFMPHAPRRLRSHGPIGSDITVGCETITARCQHGRTFLLQDFFYRIG
jgi:hypothetical protein